MTPPSGIKSNHIMHAVYAKYQVLYILAEYVAAITSAETQHEHEWAAAMAFDALEDFDW